MHHSTVARKLNRLLIEYSDIEAQKIAFVKSANKGNLLKLTIQFSAHIESKLQRSWSSK